MPILPRHIVPTLRRALATFPAVLLTGARQSGKTTLLRAELAQSHGYVSLDRPDLRERAAADPVAFLGENPPPVVIDEIQHVPILLPYIKERIDAHRAPGAWVITGSQKLSLMRGVSESLAGRVAVLELDPLSVREVTGCPPVGVDRAVARVFGGADDGNGGGGGAAAADPPGVADWLLRGGFPEPRLNPAVDRRLWLAGYVRTYLERDVRDLIMVGDLTVFQRFVRLLAARSGSLLNMASLGRELGVSGPTVRRWLSVLEASHLVVLLPPYHRNFGKRLRRSPKVHVLDPGLITFLTGIHGDEAALHGPLTGALMESAVVGEWVKLLRQAGEPVELYHFRASSGLEVDLVFERDGVLHGIEVKATATPLPRHRDGLRRWLDLAGPGARGALACRVPGPTSLGAGIRAVPWHLAF